MTVILGRHAPAAESPPLIIITEMEEMILRLGFSQTVAMKLVDEEEKNPLCTLANLSEKDITAVSDVIRRPGG